MRWGWILARSSTRRVPRVGRAVRRWAFLLPTVLLKFWDTSRSFHTFRKENSYSYTTRIWRLPCCASRPFMPDQGFASSSRVGIAGLLVKNQTFLRILTWSLLHAGYTLVIMGRPPRPGCGRCRAHRGGVGKPWRRGAGFVATCGADFLQEAVFAFRKISSPACLLPTGSAGFLLQLRTGLAAVAVKIHGCDPTCLPMRRRLLGHSVGSMSSSHCHLILPGEADGPGTPPSSSLSLSALIFRHGGPSLSRTAVESERPG